MAADVEKEILEVETRFWAAIRDGDVAAASDLLDEASLVTGAQGVARLDRAAFAGMMQSGNWTLHAFSFDQVDVLEPMQGVAVIAYKVTEDVTIDGERMSMTAADASTWVKRGGGWKCVLHTESVEGDPFGRDRQR